MDSKKEQETSCQLNDKSCSTGLCGEAKCSPCIVSKIALLGGLVFAIVKFIF